MNASDLANISNLSRILQSGTVLKSGAKGQTVVSLQAALMALGYSLPQYGADGDFGGETVAALKRFQSDSGIAADGVAGVQTGRALAAVLASMTGDGSGGTGASVNSTIPGFNPDPIIRNGEQPTKEDLSVHWGLVAILAAGGVWYANKQGWLDSLFGKTKRKR